MSDKHAGQINMQELERRTQAVSTLTVIVLVMLLVQLWLLTAAMEHSLAGKSGMALPTFIASAVCFLVNLRLLRYVDGIDRNDKEN